MNIPKLRFKEFTDEWKKEKFKDFSYYSGKRNRNNLPLIAYSITNTNGFVPQTEAHNEFGYMKNTDRTAYNIVTSNSFAYNPARINVGSIGYYSGKEDIIVSSLYEVFKLKNYINDKFIWYWLKSEKLPYWINKLQEGSVRQYFYYDKLCETFLYHPSLREQIKISNTLELLDKKIELQTKKIEALKLFKLGIKNRMFENGGNKLKLKDILSKWKEKNKNGTIKYVESINNKHGFISQLDQFEDRSVASKDLKNYYIIRKNVFGYNPSRLNVGSLALKENDTVSVVSPLYECFTTNQNNKFLLEWFDSKYFRRGASSKFEGGVRNTLNFSNLCEIEINLPSLEKQDKYASILSTFDKKIYLEDEKLNKLNNLKKGLLQKMFV